MLSLKNLAALVAKKHGISNANAEAILNDTFLTIAGHVAGGNEVSIHNFGKFKPKESSARTGRNPSTGKPIEIAASQTLGFKASSTLKVTK